MKFHRTTADQQKSNKSRSGFRISVRDYTLIIPLLAILLIVTLIVALIWITSRDNQSETEKAHHRCSVG